MLPPISEASKEPQTHQKCELRQDAHLKIPCQSVVAPSSRPRTYWDLHGHLLRLVFPVVGPSALLPIVDLAAETFHSLDPSGPPHETPRLHLTGERNPSTGTYLPCP